MKVVIQKVSKANVEINKQQVACINKGFVVLVGIINEDTQEDIDWLCRKIVNLRVFEDENGIMNKSLIDTNGSLIVVSQFTLHALTKKGNRPSYIKAAKPEVAIPIYQAFISSMESYLGNKVQTGQFGAHMNVELANDGPITIILDSKHKE